MTLPLLRSVVATTIALTTCGCSVFGIRTTEEPEYTILTEDDDFEVREYASYVVAETTTQGDYDDAETSAFYRLFDYISGENEGERSLAMTAPVLQEAAEGEELAMTAPVLIEESSAEKSSWTMAFVLPADVTIDTAPIPTNPDVRLREVPAQRVATIRYGGLRSEEKIERYSQQLLEWIEEQGLRPTSEPRYAGYDPPFTIPFLRRNEVQVDVESTTVR